MFWKSKHPAAITHAGEPAVAVVDANLVTDDSHLRASFERVTKIYPHVGPIDDAWKAFRRLRPDDGLVAEILAAIEHQKRHDEVVRTHDTFPTFKIGYVIAGGRMAAMIRRRSQSRAVRPDCCDNDGSFSPTAQSGSAARTGS
jgi:hypothetical protein